MCARCTTHQSMEDIGYISTAALARMVEESSVRVTGDVVMAQKGEYIWVTEASDVWAMEKAPLTRVAIVKFRDNGSIDRCAFVIRTHGSVGAYALGPISNEEFLSLKTGISTDKFGQTKHFLRGKLHRDGDLPAVEDAVRGRKEWYQNGEHHREGDLPSITEHSSSVTYEAYCCRGRIHRADDKPAKVFLRNNAEEYCEWYEHGVRNRTNNLPAVVKQIPSQGYLKQEWWAADKIWRECGKAQIITLKPDSEHLRWFWQCSIICAAVVDADGIYWYAGDTPSPKQLRALRRSVTAEHREEWRQRMITSKWNAQREALSGMLPLRNYRNKILPCQEFAYEATLHQRWAARLPGIVSGLPDGVLVFV